MSVAFLIIGPSWVGDMIMSQVLYKHLKNLHPKCHITVVAPSWSIPVVERMPEVDEYIELPVAHGELGLKTRYNIACRLRKREYTQAIVLPNSWKSALIPFLARVPRRTGWFGEFRIGLLNDIRILDKEKYPKMIDRFLALGVDKKDNLPPEVLLPKLTVSNTNLEAVTRRLAITMSRSNPILALCPGAAYGPAKRWPEEYFIELANEQIELGWKVWFFGSNADAEVINNIMVKLKQPCRSFAGELSLMETIDLFSRIDAMVCNDSGLMHMGASIGVPLVAIYGSTTPKFTPPLSNKAVIMEEKNLPCRPCFKRVCPLKHFSCMQSITPNMVQQALLQVTS